MQILFHLGLCPLTIQPAMTLSTILLFVVGLWPHAAGLVSPAHVAARAHGPSAQPRAPVRSRPAVLAAARVLGHAAAQAALLAARLVLGLLAALPHRLTALAQWRARAAVVLALARLAVGAFLAAQKALVAAGVEPDERSCEKRIWQSYLLIDPRWLEGSISDNRTHAKYWRVCRVF